MPESTESENTPVVADEVLLASVDLARRALLEVTAPETVGSVVGHLVEGEHVLTLLFASDLSGYPGWRWSVTLSRVDADAEPTVLETELMPGETALLAPEWVPWSERLADYRAAQEAIAAAAGESADDDADPDDDELGDGELDEDEDDDEPDDDSDDDDDDELDADDHDDHGDDEFDGIDIDALDQSSDHVAADVDDDDDADDDDDSDDDAVEDQLLGRSVD